MSIQKDLERLINEAMDAMDEVRAKLNAIQQINNDLVAPYASKFVDANEALNDILANIEDLDA